MRPVDQRRPEEPVADSVASGVEFLRPPYNSLVRFKGGGGVVVHRGEATDSQPVLDGNYT